MKANIQAFVASYVTYQMNKVEHLHLAGLLQTLQVPTHIWFDILMDFIERLPKSRGKFIPVFVVNIFPNMHILFLWPIHTLLILLLTFSLSRSLVYIACLN